MTESDTIANLYIDYNEDEDLSGTTFEVSDDTITITQETEEWDEDGENEEPSVYKILKSETNPELWTKIKSIAQGKSSQTK